MTNWKKYKLSELGILARGKSKHRPRDAAHLYGGPYPFIQTGDVKNANHRISSYSQTYSEAGLAQSKLWPKDTVCITIAANIADTAILNFPSCFPDSVLGFIADTKRCSVDYIEYMLQHFQKQVRMHSIGSVQENINLGTFENISFPVPDLQFQNRIASILSSLDDKIELNRRMNQTLEQMATTLFKKYFVDDIDPENLPEGWRKGKLGDLLYFKNGKSSPSRNENAKYAVYGSNGIIGYSNISNAKSQSIIVGRVGSFCGSLYFTLSECYVTDNAIIAEAKNEDASVFNYLLLQSLRLNDFKGGSGQPLINQTALSSIDVIIPPIMRIQEFDKIALSFYQQIFHNDNENHNLSKIRDTLLPKLISGEIDLSTINEKEALHEPLPC